MIQGLVASLLWALNIIIVKWFLNHQNSASLCFHKAFLAGIMLLFIKKGNEKVGVLNWFLLLLAGVFSVYLNYRFSYLGIKKYSISQVALINALALVIAHKPWDLFCCLVCLGVVIGLNGQIPIELFVSMICYALGMVLSNKIQINQWNKTTAILFLGSLFFLPHYEPLHFSWMQWMLFLGISVLGYAYIMVVTFKSSRTNTALNLHPVFTYLAGLLIYHEPFYLCEAIGFLLVFIAVFLGRKDENCIDKPT